MTEPVPIDSTTIAQVSIRRAPKYPVFLILGALAGLITTLILTSSFPVDPNVGFGALFGYFALYGVPAGVLLGALVAIVLDVISVRRSARVSAEHTTVDPLPIEGEIEQ